jgi:hypothetical protein
LERHIRIKIDNVKTKYTLYEEKDKIVIEAPYLYVDENKNSSVKFDTFEIPDGAKADFVRKFFNQHSHVIAVGTLAYYLDDVLLDKVEIPEKKPVRSQ